MADDEYIGAQIEWRARGLNIAKENQGQQRDFRRTRQMLSDAFSAEASKRKTSLTGGKSAILSINSMYPPSLSHLSDLKKVGFPRESPVNQNQECSPFHKMFLKDLRSETHHQGFFLILRTFGHPHRMNVVAPIANIVEDEANDMDGLSVYTNSSTLQPEGLLPKDTVVAIKDPYYHGFRDNACLRVDHPSDIVFLELGHPMYPEAWKTSEAGFNKTAKDWKLEGNTALLAEDYVTANRCYGQGLSLLHSKDESLSKDLHRNRSLVGIHLGRYDMAKSDAMSALLGRGDSKSRELDAKALFRAGRAAYHLRDFRSAYGFFSRQLEIVPSDQDGCRELAKTETRLTEERTGVYDLKAMSQVPVQIKYNADHADFTRLLDVRQIEGRGRGLFATQELPRGSLILCEKAFMVQHDNNSTYSIFVDMYSNPIQANQGTHAVFCIEMVQRIFQNPSLSSKILTLYAGSFPQTDIQLEITKDLPTINFFHVEKIVRSNSFALPADDSLEGSGSIAGSYNGRSTGLWRHASYFNHDCMPNAQRSFVGDMMIVRANKDIAKDTEVTISYVVPDPDFETRQSLYMNTWGFKCDCKLCTTEGRYYEEISMSSEENRHIPISYSHLTHAPEQIISGAKATIKQLKKSYPDHLFNDMPRLKLVEPSDQLMLAYGRLGDIDQIQKYARECLRNLGYKLTSTISETRLKVDRSKAMLEMLIVQALVHLGYYSRLHDLPELEKEYMKLAKEEYIILNGDLTGFDELYPSPKWDEL